MFTMTDYGEKPALQGDISHFRFDCCNLLMPYNARAPPSNLLYNPNQILEDIMKEYIYNAVDGKIDVKLDNFWRALLTARDKEEFNQERSHTRADHKYASGSPISLNANDNADDWLVFSSDASYKTVELKIDLERALKTLTSLQRRYFVLNRLWGYSYSEIAGFESKSKMTICEIVITAEKKIKNFLK